MEPMPTVYPDFVPNQILTSTQLNQLRSYLDDQTRRSRVRLIGTGIACGLSIERSALVVDVGPGFGVTSDGHLIDVVERASYDHYRPYVDPEHDEFGTPAYEPWQHSGDLAGQLKLVELLDSGDWPGGEKPSDARKLTNVVLTGKVVAIYLERTSVELDSCLVTDCDNEGRNVVHEPRVLLLDQGDLTALVECRHERPAPLAIRRLHTVLPPTDIDDASALADAYARLVREVADDLAEAIGEAFDRYGPYLGIGSNGADAVRDAIAGVEADGTQRQYAYDFVKDLATAHDEMVTAACELVGTCAPATDHPRHLLLGAIGGAEGYRHHWSASPVRDVAEGDRRRVRQLFDRIGAMGRAVSFGEEAGRGEVRLTPSQTERSPLGHRALPFFYKRTKELVELWHPTTCCTAVTVWGAGDGELADVDYDYSRSSLIRIEGHVGMGCDEAADEIVGLRRQHNVEFELVPLSVDAIDETETDDVVGALDVLRGADQLWRSFWARFRELWSADIDVVGTSRIVAGLLEELDAAQDAASGDLIPAWRERRCRRPLLCDTGHLEADYLVARAELLCTLGAIEGLLSRLPGPDILEAPPEGAVVSGLDWATLVLSAERLRHSAGGMLHELPKALCGFNHATFKARFVTLAADLAALDLLASGSTVIAAASSRADEHVDQFAALRAGIAGLSNQLACTRPALDAVSACYEEVRARGAAVLADYARRAPGLEHLAGVAQGGTFVLVCDDGEVVGDFSLAGRVPCCCPVDVDDLCLPPIAHVDVVVVDLVEADRAELSFVIDVLANDCDIDEPTGRAVEVKPEEESELGGRVELIEEGRVRYQIDGPIPGAIDRFSYELAHRCGSDRGVVVILQRPEAIVPEPEPEPAPERGTIVGTVTLDGRPTQALVWVDDGEQEQTADPEFVFEVQPGRHVVSGRIDRNATTRRTVEVRPGTTVDGSLVFGERGPGIRGTVNIGAGRASGVVLDIARGPRMAPFTNVVGDARGAFELAGLEPGVYFVRDPEKRVPPVRVEIAAGDGLKDVRIELP